MRTLYIIGNGFDLAHGLKTRYIDFYEWVRGALSYEETEFITSIVGFISGISLWSDFERALGAVNTKEYLEYIVRKDILHSLENDYLLTEKEVCDIIETHYTSNYDYLIYDFRRWACSIKVNGIPPIYENLYTDDNLFFTFNYTNTLEELYGIPKEKILHIHGDAKNGLSNIIVGHNHDYQENRRVIMNFLKSEFLIDCEMVADKMVEMLNLTFKNTKEIIDYQLEDILRIEKTGIERIVAMGHSYCEIDWPYFKLLKELCPNAKWELTCYSEADLMAAYTINQQLSLHAIYSQIQDKYRKKE